MDPVLVETGGPIEGRMLGGELRLGDLRMSELEVRDHPPGDAPLPPAEGSARPAQRQRLRAKIEAGATRLVLDCLGVRRQPRDADFAAAADERRDEVGLECSISTLAGREEQFRIHGDLGGNLSGQLAPAAGGEVAYTVELLRHVKVWRFVPREIPVPLAQVRDAAGAVAGMPLSAPERLWLAPRLDEEARARAFAVLVALRFMPLGWSD